MAPDLRSAFLAASDRASGAVGARGLEYLYRLILRLSRQGGSFRQVPPAELCRAFERHAGREFGRLAPVVAGRWGLRSGTDLGRAVFLLAEQRCLALPEGETLDEYAAAGDFDFRAA